MEYRNNVLSCLENLKNMVLRPNPDPTHWVSIDFNIYAGIHNLRLYCAFSNKARSNLLDWKQYVIDRMNVFIVHRNRMFTKLYPHFNSQYSVNGPLGIILYLTNIPECVQCYNDDGKPSVPKNLGLKSRCAECNTVNNIMVVSKFCDLHAPWKCPLCGSCHLVAIDS